MANVHLLGFEISNQLASSIIDDHLNASSVSVINTINAHSYNVQRCDPVFSCALKNSTVLLPDGSGITFAARLLNHSVQKLSGFDFFIELMHKLDQKSGKVFFLGSTDHVLEKIIERCSVEFLNIEIRVLSPHYQESFGSQDTALFANKVNDFMPDVLFLGLTAPKQEKLAEGLRSKISASMIVSVGAVFDFYAQTKRRPHRVLLTFHLEWLGRLVGDPRRIYKRVFVSMPIFLGIIFWKWIRRDLN